MAWSALHLQQAGQLSLPGGDPLGRGRGVGLTLRQARAVMSRAATCLQLVPTGHEQLPAQAACALPFCLRKTMVW